MFSRIFKYSFINLIKTKSVWFFFGINLSITLLVGVVLPIFIEGMRDSFTFTMVANVIFSIVALHTSMISESNSNPEERVFILARPVTRTVYLWSKICSSLIVTLTLGLSLTLIWLISYYTLTPNSFNWIDFTSNGPVILFQYFAFAFFTIFCIILFSTFFGTIFRSFLKNKVSSIIAMLFVLLIYMVTDILRSLNDTVKNISDINYMHLIYLYYPAFIFLPVTVILALIGFKLNEREDIRI